MLTLGEWGTWNTAALIGAFFVLLLGYNIAYSVLERVKPFKHLHVMKGDLARHCEQFYLRAVNRSQLIIGAEQNGIQVSFRKVLVWDDCQIKCFLYAPLKGISEDAVTGTLNRLTGAGLLADVFIGPTKQLMCRCLEPEDMAVALSVVLLDLFNAPNEGLFSVWVKGAICGFEARIDGISMRYLPVPTKSLGEESIPYKRWHQNSVSWYSAGARFGSIAKAVVDMFRGRR